jgi:hypothetical protein
VENYLTKKLYDEYSNAMKYDLLLDIKNNEEELKRLALRVIDIEKTLPLMKENI